MAQSKSTRALDQIEKTLLRASKKKRRRKPRYSVPSLWIAEGGKPRAVPVNPFTFYLGVVRKLKRLKSPRRPKASGGEWSKDAVVYNMFIRTTAAFDHNGNGKLDLPVNADGFRETGTFLKAMAMLPYVK